jgi:hypothetical protein
MTSLSPSGMQIENDQPFAGAQDPRRLSCEASAWYGAWMEFAYDKRDF